MTRPGFALVVSVLIAITLSLVGIGAMAVGIRETAVAQAVERREHARLRAEAAAIAAVEDWSTRAYMDLDIGQARTVTRPELRITVSRIDSGLFLVRADWEDRTAAASAAGRAALLVRTYPLQRVTEYFPAAVTVEEGGTLGAGAVVVSEPCGFPAVMGADVFLDGASIVGPIDPGAAPGSEDPFPAGLLAGVATVRPDAGDSRPRPLATGGDCVPDPANWGATDPGHPCHDLLPIVHATGNLTVSGGSGRGVIVVDGDMVIDGEFEFQGFLLVRGELTVRGGATIEGAVRAATLRFDEGRIARVSCDLRPVLDGPALDRAFRPSGRFWVPVF